MAQSPKMESQSEELAKPDGSHGVWVKEIDAALKHYESYWSVATKQLKRYRDERKDESNNGGPMTRLNFFWSNTQVLKSTLYTKPPKVDVSRIWKDYTDDTARVAGIIMERLLNHDLEKDSSDFDVAARQAIDDWLIVGSGQVWYRYDVETEQVPVPPTIDPMTGMEMPALDEEGQPAMEERILSEDALSDYVYWKDFICSPARTWSEVRWVARRVLMARDPLVERFGDIGKEVPLYARNYSGSTTSSTESDEPWATAEVWEIWCKTTKKVYWFVKGFDKFLDERDDPLGLEGFFPCPQPMLANQTNDTLIPRSDYSMARDQYQQIDVLVTRLRLLISACKVAGAYDKDAAGALSNILEGADNKMVPVDNWALFGEKGGIKGVMDFVPIDQIANVVQVLRADLAEQKQQLYETLGIADIMRGATRASETATAQQIKAQFGSTRLQFKQFEVARFVRDAQRIKADIIANHYQPDTMKMRSNIMSTADAQHADQAIELLKNKGVVEYRVQVEADSMAAMDWANERDSRTQFLSSMGAFVQQVMPLAQAKPEATPMLLQLIQWAMAGFRAGKEIEGVIDQAIQGMAQQPPVDPEQKAMEQAMKQAEIKKKQSEGAKNESAAVKNMAEAKGKHLENQSNEAITEMMARPPVMDSAQDASYIPPNEGAGL